MLDFISARELAKFLGVTPGFVSHIRTGRRPLPIKYAKLISQRYGVPLHVLRPDVYDPPV
jgi:transcriptional regulator with XRE-family HTH domain